MKCPLCKYEPKLKKDGDVRKRYEPFEVITVYGEMRVDYSQKMTHLGYCCPKCGIMFREVENENNN
jgi:acetone carboxylase gamma subunit